MTTSNPPLPRRTQMMFAGSISIVLFAILIALMFFCGWVFLQRTERLFQGYIYPNVYALGVNLGGLTVEHASSALEDVAAQVDTGLLVLTDGDGRWSYAWSEAGMYVDTTMTAQAAYNVGREGGWRKQLRVWLNYEDVAPRFAFDATSARTLLEALSQEISVPPIEPTIQLQNGEIVIVPGEVGRVLNATSTLAKLQTLGGDPYRVEISLDFDIVSPLSPDTTHVKAQAEALLSRTLSISAYEVLTDEMLIWTLKREHIAEWLHLVPGPDGTPEVAVNLYAVQAALVNLAEGLGDGRGFRFEQAAQQVWTAFDSGEQAVTLYLTHPERIYKVQAGDTLTSLSAKFGMPPGLVAEANTDIDVNHLSVGQSIVIPSQDVLTPHLPVPDKKIVVNIDQQRTRVYENGALLHEWIISTGIKDSPTHRGTFQVLGTYEKAYASQWDLWMPYFIAVYNAGGGVENGFHELPILANGNRLWAGSLGRPASFGCIILGIPEAETLYQWVEVGVTVVIE